MKNATGINKLLSLKGDVYHFMFILSLFCFFIILYRNLYSDFSNITVWQAKQEVETYFSGIEKISFNSILNCSRDRRFTFTNTYVLSVSKIILDLFDAPQDLVPFILNIVFTRGRCRQLRQELITLSKHAVSLSQKIVCVQLNFLVFSFQSFYFLIVI